MTNAPMTLPNPDSLVMESGQPVRGFRGELVDMTFGQPRSGSNSTPLKFSHLKTEFFDTTTPYPNGAQYTIECPWSEKGTGRWAVICESAKACLGLGEEDRLVMGELKKKMIEWRWTGGHPTRVPKEDGNPGGDWVASTMDAWIISGIDSNRHPDFPTPGGQESPPEPAASGAVAGGTNGAPVVEESPPAAAVSFEGVAETAHEYAIALSYGHSSAEWQRLALDHPIIKADKDYWDAIVATGEAVLADDSRVKLENDVFLLVVR